MNQYVTLTREFNQGRLRAILSSGQAVVLHHLAVMSKDGDWILREDEEATNHILNVLESMGARYRFGAPLDIRWMRGGWSSHFEFRSGNLRVRTDFVTRPPRISRRRLSQIWQEQESRDMPFVDLVDLVELKKTNREKDYAVIGEIARALKAVDDRLRYSRSARELMEMASEHPDAARMLTSERPLLAVMAQGLAAVEQELDAERRRFMHANEARLRVYLQASEGWAERWKQIEPAIAGLPLAEAHQVLVEKARCILPFDPTGEGQ